MEFALSVSIFTVSKDSNGLKGRVMQIEKALINDRLGVLKVP